MKAVRSMLYNSYYNTVEQLTSIPSLYDSELDPWPTGILPAAEDAHVLPGHA